MIKPCTTSPAGQLRRRAETQLRKQNRPQPSVADTQRLLHELQVHQIELEMQNEQLQAARDTTETLLEKYTDLYDFAPVGYFSVDERGQILDVNLTGAALLGVERSRLVNRSLPRFAAPISRLILQSFLQQVFSEPGRRACEASLLKVDGIAFWASVHATCAFAAGGRQKWCRLAISDITALKEGLEAQHRMEILATTNAELRQEIIQRQLAESALTKSEQLAHRMQEQLRTLSHQLLRVQEEERKRISRELHDEIIQTLVGITVNLASLKRRSQLNPRELRRSIARTSRLVEAAVRIVHHFARELRPTILDDVGLNASLRDFMNTVAKRTGIQMHFTTFTGVERLNSDQRTILYRIAQEALTNVARHSQANRVQVVLAKQPRTIGLTVQDDGKAFEVDAVLNSRKPTGLGILGMRERVEMVGGSFTIESTPGKGTTICAQIPFRTQPRQGRKTAPDTTTA